MYFYAVAALADYMGIRNILELEYVGSVSDGSYPKRLLQRKSQERLSHMTYCDNKYLLKRYCTTNNEVGSDQFVTDGIIWPL